ncbi:MAG: C_GCAxxG_C_C family protein [Desulfobacteraceae bacterium]|nr:C_GCAxxG_C_C family protein [Desulfobacteraceae bacterium]MBC2754246.1 C_GCAxxG_C_C family protein [Desulfobacteraceae bacterium]
MTGSQDNDLIKAVTGLEGGCVACGSTCGVVSGGSLGIALNHESEIAANGLLGEKKVLRQVGEYADWFGKTYGSSFCRGRTRTDFYSTLGQLKYFLTIYRLAGCFRHIRGSMRYLYQTQHPAKNDSNKTIGKKTGDALHCARAVLEGIRENTGIGNKRLENLSFVFDGGVGLSGGVCGALVGAVTGINLLLGLSVRNMSYWKIVKGFGIGHVNLLVDRPFGTREPFQAGKRVVKKFKEIAGSFECEVITEKKFSGWDDFQEFIKGASRCRKLMDFAVEEASGIIRQYK